MVGKFTQSNNLEQIRSHLLHGRIIYLFTGVSFVLLHYNSNEEKGIKRTFSIVDNKELETEECSLFDIIKNIKLKMTDKSYNYLLYYGDLSIENSIYDFMKEFYNPSEELPLIVVTAMVDSENIRNDISHAGNIKGNVLTQIDIFNSKLMEEYVSFSLSEKDSGVYNIFSIWLKKCEDVFKLIFRSQYSEYIDINEDLRTSKQRMLEELNMEIRRLGIPV